jgi:hypothetical protein
MSAISVTSFKYLHNAGCDVSLSSQNIVLLVSTKPIIIIIIFQALNFPVESFGLLNDLFPFPPILDAGYPVLDLQLANVLFDVILPSVLGSS